MQIPLRLRIPSRVLARGRQFFLRCNAADLRLFVVTSTFFRKTSGDSPRSIPGGWLFLLADRLTARALVRWSSSSFSFEGSSDSNLFSRLRPFWFCARIRCPLSVFLQNESVDFRLLRVLFCALDRNRDFYRSVCP